MKYDFSAQFLRIKPPDTSFGQAWESLCYKLLDAKYNDNSLIRLQPPDKGVDILHRSINRAYQCKSDERGAFGSIGANESIKSLKAAYAEKKYLNWSSYVFSSNANYTGSAFTKIKKEALSLGLKDEQINFLGPEYWEKLCVNYPEVIADYFDYRVSVSEADVVKAFSDQRYYPRYVNQFSSQIKNADFFIRVRNNRTPVILEVPFSPELTVENLVDVVKDLLGVSLDWTNFTDLGTSAGPSIAITVNRKKQSFNKKISELILESDNEIQFWITIVWRDKKHDDGEDAKHNLRFTVFKKMPEFNLTERDSMTYEERKNLTVKRSEEIIETMIWDRVREL